jgi:hypothetical protein
LIQTSIPMEELIESITTCNVHGKTIPIITHTLNKNFVHSVTADEVCNALKKYSDRDLECVDSVVLAQPGETEIRERAHGEYDYLNNQIIIYALKSSKNKEKPTFKIKCKVNNKETTIDVSSDDVRDRVLNNVIPHEVCHAKSKCKLGKKFVPSDEEEEYARKCASEFRRKYSIAERPIYAGGFCAVVKE